MRNLVIIIFLAMSGIFRFHFADAKIIRVPEDSSTIQGGINGALNGDTVLVSQGVYYERINFLGKKILVASNFIFDQDTSTIDSTVIDADTSILGTSDTGSVVCFVWEEDSSSKIWGFTLRNGYGLRFSEYTYGGGIACFSSSPQIGYNRIVDNSAYYGGGICCFEGNLSPLIIGNRFMENHAAIGGAILCESSSPLVIENAFFNNHADIKGGAIFFKICSPRLIDNHFEKNSTDGYGGGICGHSGSLTLLENRIIRNGCETLGGGLYCAALDSTQIGNNLFFGNSAQDGGGVYSLNCSSLIFNNTIVKNSADYKGGGILCEGSVYYPVIVNNLVCLGIKGEGIRCDNNSHPFISYNDVWGNMGGNFYGCPAGVGDTCWGNNFNDVPSDSFYNIMKDPLFVDTLNFRLTCHSPGVDAGDPSYFVLSDSGGCRVDMGFWEYPYILGDANSDGAISLHIFNQIDRGSRLAGKDLVTVEDIVFMVNYIFLGGTQSCPFHSADTNCDGRVNIADIVCLLNYLFVQGPLPCSL